MTVGITAMAFTLFLVQSWDLSMLPGVPVVIVYGYFPVIR